MDAVLFTLFVHMLTVENRMGWGLFKDQRYLVFGFFCITLYVLIHVFHTKLLYKFLVIFLFILTTIVGVGGSYIQARHVHGATLGINDSGIQNEIGGKLLLLGINPYSIDYKDTDLKDAPYTDEEGNTENPALYAFAYPPFAPMLTAAVFRIMAPVLGWFDVRVIYLGSLLFLLGAGYIKWKLSGTYLLFLILVGLNPYFVRSTIEGSNDVVSIFLFFAALIIVEKKKVSVLSGVLFGLAIATKQIIWPAVPFMFFAAWQTKQYVKGFVLGFAATSALIFGPFVIWDFQGLMNGLLLYHAGSLAHSYPIHNFGFGMLLWQLGIVKSIYEYYPFGVWQGGGMLIVVTLLYLKRILFTPSQIILVGWTACLFILFLFNRAMNYSYLGIMEVAVSITILWYDSAQQSILRKSDHSVHKKTQPV